MNIFKKLALYCSLLNLAFAPTLSYAQSAPQFSSEDADRINKVHGDFPTDQGYRYVFTKEGNVRKIVVYDKDNNPAIDIPLSNPDTLKEFSPRKLNDRMKEEMSKVWKTSKGAFSHSAKNLPTESAIFFMAMGAVVASQLVTDYASNPLGMQQHIQHQLSPIGMFGFYTFMASQGVTSNILQAYITNPKFGKYMIPYLGMTVGAFVQSNISLILTDPNVKACSKLMMGKTVAGITHYQQAVQSVVPGMKEANKVIKAGSDKIVASLQVKKEDYEKGIDEDDPCHIAYQHMVVDQVPMITSMLISSFMAAGIEKAITAAASRTAGYLAKKGASRLALGAVDVVLWLFPGGVQVKGFRLFVTKGLQIAMFVELDHWLNSKVTFAWKSQKDGGEFKNIDKALVQQMLHHKRNKWNADPTSFIADLKNFHKKSAEWRQINLGDVYTAHQNWMDMFQQLMSMYNASHSFYGSFVEQIIAAKGGDPIAQLNLQHPFIGVKAKGLTEGSEELYFTDSESLVDRQKQTIQEVASYLSENITNGTFKKNGLNKQTIEVLTLAQNDLVSADNYKKGHGISRIKGMLTTDSTYVAANFLEWSVKGKPIHNEYKKLMAMLGEPEPVTEQGRGFLYLYEKYSADAEGLKGLQWPGYDSNTKLGNPRVTEYFVSQMIFGPSPEKNEEIIDETAGFPAKFVPPKIVKNTPQIISSNKSIDTTIFTQKFSLHDGWLNNTLVTNSKANYENVNEYLKANTLDTVITNKGKNNFETWWRVMTESQMIEAFDIYTEKYQDIVVKLVKKIFNTDTSSVNAGPMANGAIHSVFQEARVYQMILGELLKDTYREQYKTELPLSYFYTDRAEPIGPFLSNNLAKQKLLGTRGNSSPIGWVSLLSPMREAGTMEFDRLAQPFTRTLKGPAFSTDEVKMPRGFSLTAQARIEGEMYQLAQMLKRIKIKPVTKTMWFDGEVIDSDLANYELDEQKEKIDAAIATFAKLLGVNLGDSNDVLKSTNTSAKASERKEGAAVILSQAQQKLALSALQNLGSVANEILTYGKIANAVSWDELQNLKQSEKEKIDFNRDAANRKVRSSFLDIK